MKKQTDNFIILQTLVGLLRSKTFCYYFSQEVIFKYIFKSVTERTSNVKIFQDKSIDTSVECYMK